MSCVVDWIFQMMKLKLELEILVKMSRRYLLSYWML